MTGTIEALKKAIALIIQALHVPLLPLYILAPRKEAIKAVVVKDVRSDCVVVGIPARIVKRNGKRVDEPL
jgi:serine O-acetyltransferase